MLDSELAGFPVGEQVVGSPQVAIVELDRECTMTCSAGACAAADHSISLSGLEIDHQLEFARLHDGQVGGLFAPQNATDIDAGFAKRIGSTAAIAYQSAGLPAFCLSLAS
jgi:hypothetical protein